MSEFKSSKDGRYSVYVGDNPEDQLAAMLNPSLENKPNADVQRRSDITTAKTGVDAVAQPANVAKKVLEVMARGNDVADDLDRAFNDMYPDAYAPYQTERKAQWYNFLIGATGSVRGQLDNWKAAFPYPAIPYPITTADISALSARLAQLSAASPDECKPLVMDGVKRGDVPFLHAAGSAIRSGLSFRNNWKPADAQKIAEELLEAIDFATWTPENEVAKYCEEQVERYSTAWRYFVNNIKSAMRLDPIYRQSGALAPILMPESAEILTPPANE